MVMELDITRSELNTDDLGERSLTRHINSATAVRIPQRPDLAQSHKGREEVGRRIAALVVVTLTHKLSGRFMSLFFSQSAAYKKPLTEDVLDSLAMDASDPEDNFMSGQQFGYDPDSRRRSASSTPAGNRPNRKSSSARTLTTNC